MIYILILFASNVETIVDMTNIFHPLYRKYAAMPREDTFFFLDRFEQNLYIFEDHQRRLIARKGPGPGELDRVNKLSFMGNKLYSIGAVSINIYDRNGHYLETIRLKPGLEVIPTENGWLGFGWSNKEESASLCLYNQDMKTPEILTTWDETNIKGSFVVPGKEKRIKLSPERSAYSVNRDGKTLFYRLPGDSSIIIYSLDPLSRVGEIDLGSRHIPFNRDLGQKKLEEAMAKYPALRLEPEFPEFYPIMSGMKSGPEGGVVVARETGRDELSLRWYDDKGNSNDGLPLSWSDIDRIIYVYEDYFYITFETEDGDYGIARVHCTKLADFISDNPITD